MDERSEQLVARGMAVTLGLLYVVLFVSCIWKYVTTKDITNSTLELILIVMIPGAIAWFARKDESLLIPTMSTTGKEIPTGTDEKSVKKRKKHYFIDAIGLAFIFLLFTIIDSLFIQKQWDHFSVFPEASESINITASLSLEFLLSIIIFYAIAYVLDEWKVKRYNKRLEELGYFDE